MQSNKAKIIFQQIKYHVDKPWLFPVKFFRKYKKEYDENDWRDALYVSSEEAFLYFENLYKIRAWKSTDNVYIDDDVQHHQAFYYGEDFIVDAWLIWMKNHE